MPLDVLSALGSSVLLAACSSIAHERLPEPSPAAEPAEQVLASGPSFPLFPPASGDLELAGPEEGTPSMLDLVLRYGELTGQVIGFSPSGSYETRKLMASDPVPFEGPVRVPAAEVQRFVETLLADNYVLTIGHSQEPRIVFVYSLKTPARSMVRSQAISVPLEALAEVRAHPAVLFTTLVELPHSDVRTLSNSLRSLIVDPNLLTIIPLGGHSLLVSGRGSEIASLVEHLLAIDAEQAPSSPAPVRELVRLSHADAEHIAPLVREVFPTAKIQPYGRLNALVIACPKAMLAEIQDLIALLDSE
jgi:hypothetical protein